MKTNANRALAVMFVILLTTVAAAPMLYDVEEAEAAWVDDDTQQAIKWWLRVLPVTSQLVGVYDYLTLDQRGQTLPAGDDDTVKAYARDVDALRSAEQMHNIFGIASSLVNSDTNTWKLTNSYLNRSAEVSAGDLWYNGAVFDGDDILDYAGIYESIGNGNRNTQEILDEAVRVSMDMKQVWNNTSYGSPLDIELKWGDRTTGVCDSRLALDFLSIADTTPKNNIVYLTQTSTENAPDTATSIWAYTTTGTITPIADGSPPISLSLGANDVSNLPSGFYTLSSGTYGGPFLPSVNSANAASVKGGAGIIKDDDYGYITVSNEAIDANNYSRVSVNWDGGTDYTSTIDVKISGSSEVQTSLNAPFELVTSYVAYYDQLSSLLDEAARSAHTMWAISSVANENNILLSPSSIIPSLRDHNISAEQAYAMYVLALDQIAQYDTSYGEVLRSEMTKVSSQSLELYCQGSLYASDGSLVADDIIFTPYIYVGDWNIYSGDRNIFDKSGMVFVWDEGTTLDDWDGPASSDNYGSMLMEKGQFVRVNEIVYKGEQTSHVRLQATSVDQIDVFSGVGWDRVDPPAVLDASTLIMIILIEASLIIGLIGYATGQRALYIVALIVLLIGALASDPITLFIWSLL